VPLAGGESEWHKKMKSVSNHSLGKLAEPTLTEALRTIIKTFTAVDNLDDGN
jgi:hypothetical protein